MSNEHDAPPVGDVLVRLVEEVPLLAEAIVDTIQESLILLDPDLKVVLANCAFYSTFKAAPAETVERMVYDLGDGQWDIPGLRKLLEDVLPGNHSFSGYEVIHTFPYIGRKVMVLNGRKLRRREGQADLILLVIQDQTALHERETALQQLVREKQVLVREVHHRVKNNLQTIASMLSLHCGYADDPRVTEALTEAGARVQAIAYLHHRLYASGDLAEVNIGEYLRNLTRAIETLHGRPEISFDIDAADMVLDMDRATPLALIANELILNCFKHAFPEGRSGHVAVSLRYIPDRMPEGQSLDDGSARLEVQDDGDGFPSGVDAEKPASMGLEIVRLLSRQLHAEARCITANGVRWTVTFPLSASKQQEEALDERADSGR